MIRPPRSSRRGAITIVAIACLAIVSVMVFSMARDAARSRRETRTRLQLMQTDRLLDAGVLRARLRLRNDSDYSGETWTPDLAAFVSDLESRVVITIDDDTITVSAALGQTPAKTTKTYSFSARNES